MECKYCKSGCIKAGKIKGNLQRFYCKHCNRYQQGQYTYQACHPQIDAQIKALVKESCGVQSIGRLLSISNTTVIKRILKVSKLIEKPIVKMGKTYEMDELKTCLKRKSNERWVVYAINKASREVVDFRVGRRTKATLGKVAETLILSGAKRVYTNGYGCINTCSPKKFIPTDNTISIILSGRT